MKNKKEEFDFEIPCNDPEKYNRLVEIDKALDNKNISWEENRDLIRERVEIYNSIFKDLRKK